MNFSSLLAIGATAVSLILSLWLFISGLLSSGQQGRGLDQQSELLNHQTEFAKLQQQAQIQQQQIQAGQRLQEQGKIILSEIAVLTYPPKSSEPMKSLLARHKIPIPPLAATPAATPGTAAPVPRVP